MGNLFAITDPHALWNIVGLQKLINFIITFYLCLPKENKEKKVCQGAKNTSLGLLSTCLPVKKFCFDAMLCCNFGNENSDAYHVKCSTGPDFSAGRKFTSSGINKSFSCH